MHGTNVFAETDERVVGASAGICIEIDVVELVGSGFGDNKKLVFFDVLDIVRSVSLGSCANVPPFLNFKIITFKTNILSTLFEGIIRQDTGDELAEKLVQAPVSFPVEEFAF